MRECVAALVIRQQMILLGQRAAERSFYPNVWDVFGGHVETGETHEQALRRELEEELGIIPTQWDFLMTFDEPEPERHGAGCHHFYRVKAWHGTPANLQLHEHVQIQWFTLDQSLRLDLAHPAYVELFREATTVIAEDYDK